MRVTDWLAVWADYLNHVPEADQRRIGALLTEAAKARNACWEAYATVEHELGDLLKDKAVRWPTGREGQVAGLDVIDKVWKYQTDVSFAENVEEVKHMCWQMHFNEMEMPDIQMTLSAELHNVDKSFLRKLKRQG